MEVDEIKEVRLDKLKTLTEKFKIKPYGGKYEVSSKVAETLANFEEGQRGFSCRAVSGL